jgi:hypothetical protein
MRRITADMLKGACAEQLRIFRREWPKGAPVSARSAARAAKLGLDAAWVAKCLLSAPALAQYEAACATALAQYEAACAPALAQYEAACATALAQYEAACATALAQYEAVRAPALAQYEAARWAALWPLLREA